MAIYSKKIIIPANTPKHQPVKIDFEIKEKEISFIKWFVDEASANFNAGIKIIGIDRPGEDPAFMYPVDMPDYLWTSGEQDKKITLLDRDSNITILGYNENLLEQTIGVIIITN